MKATLVDTLRRDDLSLEEFRLVTERLAWILAAEAGDFLPKEDLMIRTPLSEHKGQRLAGEIVLVPVLRAGLAFLSPFMSFYPNAAVGFVGLKRDEATAVARCYLSNLPPIGPNTHVFILEPMLATGGSALKAVQILLDAGAKEQQILVASAISAPAGLERLSLTYPKVRLLVAQKDSKLSPEKYIVPGLGDFGDRFLGTPPAL